VKSFITFRLVSILFLSTITVIFSCSKGGGGGGGTPVDPCAAITIIVNGTTTNPSGAGATDGTIATTASGSSGFTFSINGGPFQSSGNFINLAAGSYTIVAKNASGCTGSASFTLAAQSACAGVTINVSPVVTSNNPCQANNGTITLTATGGTGSYLYSLSGSPFQASNIFSNLNAGSYSATAKDANGCTGTSSAVVNNAPAGPLFSAVKTLLDNNCVSCHNNAVSEGGMNWTIDCNIVANKDRIKARAVDGTPSSMPPTGLLSASDRQKITDWINAGGRYSN
jgi:hypothetical protein